MNTEKFTDFLKENPSLATHFVGVAISIEDEKISEILVGISGLETWLSQCKKPFHSKEEILRARDIILDFVIRNELPLAEGYKINMVFI